ncbi:coiled-coil domain-containing protein 78-like isoform X1 [Hydractinia symbiolongicarpus]|uniref:coiled-coil domain-containing protein 78-like isoform X1 n=1 Tax=Hydractinia symbiolongicarpus TaxID=13093 RepID=UPI00254F806C|nr:coiled-coil domain-containing protein 78-like isoform X1 [Hydractinia symbiolongicarpus]
MTAIQGFCRICDSEKNTPKGKEKYTISENQVTYNSTSYTFNKVFYKPKRYNEIYAACLEDLERYFLSGYNTSFLFLGAVKSQLLHSDKGLLSYIIEQIYNAFSKQCKAKEGKKSSTLSSNRKDEILIRVIEVQQDNIKDLLCLLKVSARNKSLSGRDSSTKHTDSIPTLETPSPVEGNVQVVEDDFNGIMIENAKVLSLGTLSSTVLLSSLQESLHQSEISKDSTTSNLIIELALQKIVDGFDIPVSSWFRFICLPAASNENEQFMSSVDVLESFIRLATPHAYDSVNRSHVTVKMLSDMIGGNCITNFMLLMEPYVSMSNKHSLETATKLCKLHNYPVDNSPHMKSLLRQYRIKIKALQRNLSKKKNIDDAFIEELKEKIAHLDQENKQLHNEKENLENMMSDVKEKYNKAVVSHADISSKNVFSTEEKLKMSKEAIELRIHTNKIQQEAETQFFELKNKLLIEQEKTSKLERHLAFERKVHTDLKEKFDIVNKDKKDLLEEYINLKANYQSVKTRYQQEKSTNEGLNEMVCKLSEIKEKMDVEKTDLQCQQIKHFNEQLHKLKLALSNNKKQVEVEENESLLKNFVDHDEVSDNYMKQLQEKHHKELQSLENLIFSLKKKLVQNEETIFTYQRKLAQTTSKMLIMKDEKEFVDTKLSDVELKFKNLSHEYRTRLHQYISDLKNFVSGNSNDNTNKAYIESLDNMMKDLQTAFDNEVKTYYTKLEEEKKTSQMIVVLHEKLLIAYRLLLKNQTEDYNEQDASSYEILLPPDEEIQTIYTKERNELRTKLCIAEEKVKDLQENLSVLKQHIKEQELNGSFGESNMGDIWNGVRKKVRDFTTTVQHNLEKERAELLTRCHLAEQQLETYQEMMEENHKRYQIEISHLQHLLSERQHERYVQNNLLAIEDGNGGVLPPIHPSNFRYNQYSRR